jgi:hypothetical protein
MYGLVNKSIEEMVIANYGELQWLKIMDSSGIDINFFICNEFYDDDITYTLAWSVSDELSIPFDKLLFDFGEWLVLKTVNEKFPGLLWVIGPDLKKLLLNLPAWYDRMKLMYLKIPHSLFRVILIEENKVQINIFTAGEGLEPFFKGILLGLGKLYDSVVTVDMLPAKSKEFNIYLVSW